MKNRIIGVILIFFTIVLSGCAQNQSIVHNKEAQGKAYRKLGEAYLAQKNYTMALTEFLKAEKFTSNDHLLHQDLGIAYMAKEENDLAIAHFKKALDIKPDLASARNNLGTAYLAKRNYDAAISNFNEVTNDLLYATPHFPLSNIGSAYYYKKDYLMAEKYFLKSLKHQPNFINALMGLGHTYIATGKIDRAVEKFKAAVKSAPDIAQLHMDLAHAYRISGNQLDALHSYKQAAELTSDPSLQKEAQRYIKLLE